jgi:hypothetical protein
MAMRQIMTEEKIAEIRKWLKHGVREAGRRCGVSYYTAWRVSKGKYEKQFRQEKINDSICPITGFKFY